MQNIFPFLRNICFDVFEKKFFLLILLVVSVFSFGNEKGAYAKNNKNFYGKVRLGLGYESQKYTGSDVKDVFDNIDFGKNKSNQAPVISLGYNLYYRLNKKFELLGGLEIQGRYAIKGKDFVSFDNGSVEYNEFLRLSAKLGFKTNLNKKVAVETYGIIGGNMVQHKNFELLGTGRISNKEEKFTNFGLSTGVGVDFVIVDRFTIGAEYRRGFVKVDYERLNGSGYAYNCKFNMKTDSILAKIGYQF